MRASVIVLLLHLLLIGATLPMLQSESRFILGLSCGSSLAPLVSGRREHRLLVPFMILAAVRHLNGRTFLIMLGLGTSLYFAFSLDYFLDVTCIDLVGGIFNLDFLIYDWPIVTSFLWIWGFSDICRPVTLSNGHLYNNEQRKEINYWLFLGFTAIAGFFLFANSNFWLGLSIWPAASLGSLAVRSIQNRWLKDILLLLPFLAYLSTFFFI